MRTVSKIIFLFLIAGALTWVGCESVDPEGNLFYIKYYGEDGLQEGVDMVVNANDESVVLLGSTYSLATEVMKVYLVKTDFNGALKWSRTFGSTNDKPVDIEPLNGGGFIILSETRSINDNLDVKLTIVNGEGEPVDSVTYGSPAVAGQYANEYPKSVTVINDGFIVTGSSEFSSTWASPTNTDISDIFHYRFNSDLSLYSLWVDDEYNHASDNDTGIKTIQLRDDRFYVLGNTLRSTDGLTEDDLNIWYYSLGSGGIEGGFSGRIGNDSPGYDEAVTALCPAFAGGVFLVGTFSTGGNSSDIYIAQLYEDAGELFKAQGEHKISIFKGSDVRQIRPVGVCQSNYNGRGYLIVGDEGPSGSKNIWLTKVSDTGDLRWSAMFGSGRREDVAGAVAELPDGRILVLGTVTLEANNSKMTLMKLNGSGKLDN